MITARLYWVLAFAHSIQKQNVGAGLLPARGVRGINEVLLLLIRQACSCNCC